MNGWEFAADLITKAYWPLFAVVVFLALAKPLRGLIGRIREASGPGGWAVKADPEKAGAELVKSVADAAEADPLAEDEGSGSEAGNEHWKSVTATALAAARELERRIEIEQVATNAARWGQEMAETMPNRPGSYWVPVFDWSDDGTVRLTYGQRMPEGPDIVLGPGSGKSFGFVAAAKGHWKPAPDEGAEGNDPRR